jgi:hypothetical protein
MSWFQAEIEVRCRVPRPSLEIIADTLQKAFEDPKTLGLAFINMSDAKMGTDDELFASISEQKEHLAWLIEGLARAMGLECPQLIAFTAIRIIERTILRTLITGSPREVQTARLLLRCLQHA